VQRVLIISPQSLENTPVMKRSILLAEKLIQLSIQTTILVNRLDDIDFKNNYNFDIIIKKWFEKWFFPYYKYDRILVVKPRVMNLLPISLQYPIIKERVIIEFDELEREFYQNPLWRIIMYFMENIAFLYNKAIFCSCIQNSIYGNHFENIHVAYYGTDVNRYNTKNNLSNNENLPFKIVYSGFLHKKYNPRRLIDLATELVRSGLDNFELNVIGKGEELNYLKKESNKRHLDKKIHFLGYVSREELIKYQIQADILIFPIRNIISNKTRCPQKLGEYISTGNPILTNRVGIIPKILGDAGTYYKYDDLSSLTSKIRKFILEPEYYRYKKSQIKQIKFKIDLNYIIPNIIKFILS